jgi:pimeloyl-ACP methyl ester carboxylesterase
VPDHLHFEIDADGRRPVLLLLHGFLSSNLQWDPNRDRLREHFRLTGTELWGHGKSPAPRASERYRVESYVAELERIRVELGVERWLVCGQSFGAGITIRYALAHPERVRGLILTNSRSALNDVGHDARENGLEAWQALDRRVLPYHPCHARRLPSDLRGRMEAAADAIPAYALWQGTATTARDLSCRRLGAQLQVPTLLVNGRYDRRFQSDRDFALETIPDLEVVDLDAGHAVNIEAAAAFDRAVIDFARRHG